MAKPLVIYHAQCSDGFCAAWVANRYFQGEADFLPAQYGDPVPDVKGREVYILDFCYPWDVLVEMSKKVYDIILLDHHKTAIQDVMSKTRSYDDKWIELGNAVCHAHFDMDKSGGRLAWDYFFPGKPAPWLVEYTEDRDLWKWKLPDSREVSAALASYAFDFTTWNTLHAHPHALGKMAQEGRAILRYQQQVIDRHVQNAVEVELDGFKVLSVNATVCQSEIAGKLAEQPGRPFGICWFSAPDGKVVYSLRSREGGIDVSEVAKRHGGGGHRNAAGFQVSPGQLAREFYCGSPEIT